MEEGFIKLSLEKNQEKWTLVRKIEIFIISRVCKASKK